VDETQASLEAPAEQKPGCTTTPDPNGGYSFECQEPGVSIATVGGGTRALLIDDDDAKSISWLEPVDSSAAQAAASFNHPALLVTVIAPPDQGMTTAHLVDIANRF
jgi:hypothetical protein